MLGDVLLIQEKHKKAAEILIRMILRQKEDRFVLAISGESGSGKSELAHCIARGMRNHNIMAKPIHTDNFYMTHPLERKAWRIEHGIEEVVGYNEYDWPAINNTLEDFWAGRKSELPCVDLVTEQVDRLITDFSEVTMLIVDGLYALKAEHVDLRVFIELTYLETKEKHVKDERGKEVMDEIRWEILGKEHRMVQSLKPLADIIITRDFEVVDLRKK